MKAGAQVVMRVPGARSGFWFSAASAAGARELPAANSRGRRTLLLAVPLLMFLVQAAAVYAGSLQLTKVISGASSLPPDAQFAVSIACTLNGASVPGITPGSQQYVTTASPVTFGNIPVGADCYVVEQDPPAAPAGKAWAGYMSSEAQPIGVLEGGSSAVLTNTLVDAGTLTITTQLMQGSPLPETHARFTLNCQSPGLTSFSATPTQSAAMGGTTTFNGVPVGATCVITNDFISAAPAGTAWVWSSSQQVLEIQAGANDADWMYWLLPTAAVTVTSGVTGVDFTPTGHATFTLSCSMPGAPYQLVSYQEQYAALGSTFAFAEVPQGVSCGLYQRDITAPPPGYLWGKPIVSIANVFTVTAGASPVIWTDTLYTESIITVTKLLQGGTVPAGTLFPISVQCSRLGLGVITSITPSAAQSVAAGATVSFAGIPAFSQCTVTEGTLPPAPSGFSWRKPTMSSPTTLGAGINPMTVVNRLSPLNMVQVTPNYTGGTLPPETSFAVTISCSVSFANVFFATESVAPGVTAMFDGIPTDAFCTVDAKLPAPLPGYAVTETTYSPFKSFDVVESGNHVTVTATLVALSSVTITKLVSGGTVPDGTSFGMYAGCSPNAQIQVVTGTPYSIPALPGSHCFVHEHNQTPPAPPAGFAWSNWTVDPLGPTVQPGGTSVTVTNVLVPVATVNLSLSMAGGPAPEPLQFTVALACSNPTPTGYGSAFAVTGISPSTPLAVVAGTQLAFGNVPVGATCRFSLTPLPAPPAGYGWAGFSGTQSFAVVAGTNQVDIVASLVELTTLTVTKNVTGGAPVAGSQFGIKADCYTPIGTYAQLTPSGTQMVDAGGSVTFGGIPAGSSCSLWEPSVPPPPTGTMWIGTDFSPGRSMVVSGPTAVTITNKLAQQATLTVLSVVTGGTATPGSSVSFYAYCSLGYNSFSPSPSSTQQLPLGGSVTFGNIPVGASCSFSTYSTSAAPPGYAWTGSMLSVSQVIVGAGGGTVTLISELTPTTTVTVSEIVTGGSLAAGTTFSVGIECTLAQGGTYEATPQKLFIAANGSGEFGKIPVGSTCTLTDRLRPAAPSGFVWISTTFNPNPITVAAGSNVVTVTNTLAAVNSVSITKVVTGGTPLAGSVFGFSLSCRYQSVSYPAIVPAQVQSADAGGTVTWSNVPVGASCTAIEQTLPQRPPGYAWGPTTATPNPIVVTPGTNLITFTNTLAATTSLTVTTAVTGGSAPGAQFSLNTSCFSNGLFVSGVQVSGSPIVGPNTTVTFTNIPVNASCTISGTVINPLPGYTFGAPSLVPSNPVVVAAGGTTATYTAPLLPAGVLMVSAMASGATPAPGTKFTINMACSFNGQPVTPAPASVPPLDPGGAIAISGLPIGATCTLSANTNQLPVPPAGAVFTGVTVPAAPVAIASALNSATVTFTLTPTRSLAVTKTVTGGTLVPGSNFRVRPSCTFGSIWNGSFSFQSVQHGGTTTFNGIPIGATCSVTEATGYDLPPAPAGSNWGAIGVVPSLATITSDGGSATVTNTLVPTTTLTVDAVVAGGTVDPESLFRVYAVCSTTAGTVNGITPSPAQYITAGGAVTFSSIPVGATCHVNLIDALPALPSGYVWISTRLSPSSINMAAGTNALTVTYTMAPTTTVDVTKIVVGGTVPTGATFSVNVQCAPAAVAGTVALVSSVNRSMVAGSPTSFDELPVGTNCAVQEYGIASPPAGFAWIGTTIAPSQFVLAPNGASVTVTNTLTPLTTLSVTKALTGGTVPNGSSFALSLRCTLLDGSLYGGGFSPSNMQFVTTGGTIQFGGVPVGAACIPVEPIGFPMPPAGQAWASPVATPGPLLIAPTGNAITLTNRLAPGVQLSVTRLGNGGGTVDSPGTWYIACGNTCVATVGAGTQIVLAATPANGAHFVGWGGACTGLGPCVLDMAGSRTVTATFSVNQAQVALSIVKTGSGSGLVHSDPAGIDCGATCGSGYPGGTSVALTATPDAGSIFVGWLGGCVGGATCNVPLVKDVTIQAVFAAGNANPKTLDVDGNNAYDALTDGLLIFRYLSALAGSALIDAAIGPNATRGDASAVGGYLADHLPALDVDGDGRVDALTDGLLIMRYLFGLRGASLVQGATSAAATRDPGLVETYLQGLMP